MKTYEEFKKEILANEDVSQYFKDDGNGDYVYTEFDKSYYYDSMMMLYEMTLSFNESFSYEQFTQQDGQGMVTTYINGVSIVLDWDAEIFETLEEFYDQFVEYEKQIKKLENRILPE